ncbi:hypothetical protein ACFC08_18085 [Streptomyces sp. NPDC056112]|uniref:hypothetical protein n=1 Tax=Streptomyces sp. NPDC056112 TaxID=3345715 RepID=UPI0035E192A8
MLRVVYEATNNLNPGQLAAIDETRGRVTFKIREGAMADDYLQPLNVELRRFVDRRSWFQIWRGQVISANSPNSPLTVQYEADPDVDLTTCVQIREDRGIVRFHVYPGAPAELLVKVMNPAMERFLAGGQWFQYWEGEIVTMDSPGSAAA